jgi:hypothetical protein
MKKTLLLFMLWATALSASPQYLLPVWAESFGGPGWDIANTLCIADTGNVLVTGTFMDSIDIEGQRYYSNGLTDVIVASYTKDGKPLNSFTFGGIANERPLFSGYDDGLVLLVQIQRAFEIGGNLIDSTGYANFMIGWFDGNDILTSNSTIGCSKTMAITGMDCDDKGAVYLTGWYSDTLRVNGEVNSVSPSEAPLLLIIDNKGKSHSLKSVSELDGKRVNTCAIQPGNKMMVAGTTTGNDDKDLINPAIVYNTMYTATMNYGGIVNDMQTLLKGIDLRPVSIVESDESTWIAATFKYYCLNGADTLKAKGQTDILLVKIPGDKSGTQFWTIGGYGKDTPLYLKTTGSQAILTGSFCDTLWFSESSYRVSEKKGSDVFLAVFEEKQEPVEILTIGGTYNDFPRAMATSDAGVYVLGQFRDRLEIAGSEFVPEGSYDIFVSRLENCEAEQPVEVFVEQATTAEGGTEYLLSTNGGYTDYQWSDGLGFAPTAATSEAKTYTVEATNIFGCRCTGSVDIAGLKSVLKKSGNKTASNALQAKFKLYPTVTRGIVYWQPGSKYPATGATLKVYDVKGSTLLTREYPPALHPLSVQTLDMGSPVPGQYLIKVSGKGYKESMKVIVE